MRNGLGEKERIKTRNQSTKREMKVRSEYEG